MEKPINAEGVIERFKDSADWMTPLGELLLILEKMGRIIWWGHINSLGKSLLLPSV